jgi:hypothetical protein
MLEFVEVSPVAPSPSYVIRVDGVTIVEPLPSLPAGASDKRVLYPDPCVTHPERIVS